MRQHDYSLTAFDAIALALDARVRLEQQAEYFKLTYLIKGDVEQLCLPTWDDKKAKQRITGLWQQSCFECFIAKQGEPTYRELNFSPSGAWNAFAFSDYRQGMQEDYSVRLLQHDYDITGNTLCVSVKFHCPENNKAQTLALNISMILDIQGRQTYWAIRHPEKPDFHRRECFLVL